MKVGSVALELFWDPGTISLVWHLLSARLISHQTWGKDKYSYVPELQPQAKFFVWSLLNWCPDFR